MAKPTLVVLHGWGLSAARFKPLQDSLQESGYRVLVPDFPGFGESPMPPHAFYLSDYVSFLESFILSKHITSYVLIGHSFGGRVAIKFCEKKRIGLRGIILTGTPGFTPVAKSKLAILVLIAKVGKYILRLWPLEKVQEKIRAWYYYFVGAKEYYRAQGVMRDTFKNVVAEQLESYMDHITVPTLLVWGQNDQITPVWIGKKMNSRIPHATFEIISDADHGVPYKKPQQFVSRIQSFLIHV